MTPQEQSDLNREEQRLRDTLWEGVCQEQDRLITILKGKHQIKHGVTSVFDNKINDVSSKTVEFMSLDNDGTLIVFEDGTYINVETSSYYDSVTLDYPTLLISKAHEHYIIDATRFNSLKRHYDAVVLSHKADREERAKEVVPSHLQDLVNAYGKEKVEEMLDNIDS